MKEFPSTLPPSGEKAPEKDLQKEFHKIQQEAGDGAAMQYLADNYEKNPKFALRIALKMFVPLNEALRKSLIYSSAAETKARLYVAFRQLSDRQKTKVRGFKGFVQAQIEANKPPEAPELTAEQQLFNDELIRDTERYDAIYGPPGEGHGMPTTKRENYRQQSLPKLAHTDELMGKFSEIVGPTKEIIAKAEKE